ncbi:MAG: bifunctional hydroxymethylpyrimidine kinase/phosphomethylpyrimidine kinase [Chlorobiota bacterium]|nr:bifunctional hydroxymethylpyrimidine kinase/phosphomethylpyrimidine kinase [Chlorobiota bacterium]QQS66083.1 MAG: bifunctional hydroxymethylpyrimidine kinase/phosphomethylpyrimidine kinase [Chlorobiota bacterium]
MIALTIAGSDSGAGAGIQADLKTFSALNVYGVSVITSVTSQNTLRVDDVFDLPLNVIASQFKSIIDDFKIDVIKIGMLSSSDIVKQIVSEISKLEYKIPIVLDPVLVSTSGDSLVKDTSIIAQKNLLFPIITILTPNIIEASIISNMKILTLDDMKESIKIIHKIGVKNVLIKGGHLIFNGNCIDILFDGENYYEFCLPHIAAQDVHGTGCTLSSAIAGNLAKGYNLISSIKKAKDYVHGAIKHSRMVGNGNNPLYHEWMNFKSDNLT